jgi:hypothetical protein|tara:strand:+ start:469 stop:657 length:189 start_codon:yes stop_codon:yes gene_type:complete
MNKWLEYQVPKKYARLYVSHILKNVMLLVFILLFVFGKMPSALSFWFIVLLSDAAFYHAIKH